ncbi:DUF4044 domain-containing protein [Weissella koreensis]|uniref:DUF4044 domain-containing protein n=1 Tax=Weissella koreensis TaxID=165096 RepID=A0A7H1MMW8_9LACO|nr:DUF4044 domain-containing protein [Weissella koreensis]QNT64804.1 DUF4044 domain-containing protein [Weissella koreensis]
MPKKKKSRMAKTLQVFVYLMLLLALTSAFITVFYII